MEIDESPVTIEYSLDEHELLNDILNHQIDYMDMVLYGELRNLPEDSPIRVRYELLRSMRDRSAQLWSNRFGLD